MTDAATHDLAETAYHEAGHFVAAALINMLPGSISIEPGEDYFGHVGRLSSYRKNALSIMETAQIDPSDGSIIHDDKLWAVARNSADTHAFLCAAGGVAAQIFLGSDEAPGTLYDDISAMEVYEVMGEVNSFEPYEEIIDYTLHIFRDKTVWAAVEHVVHALLQNRTLDQDASADLYMQVITILGGKSAGPHFKNLQKLYPWSE